MSGVGAVQRGMFSTPGDVQYTRGYHEYSGGVQYTGGYHDKRGGRSLGKQLNLYGNLSVLHIHPVYCTEIMQYDYDLHFS